MKKIYLFSVALAGLALASCSSDDFNVTQDDPTIFDQAPISFSSLKGATTRADITGAAAADLLGNQFVVSGKKGTTTAATDGTIVFDNYVVAWEDNTANTTESNSSNWEYVGKGRIKHAIDHGITNQTIK